MRTSLRRCNEAAFIRCNEAVGGLAEPSGFSALDLQPDTQCPRTASVVRRGGGHEKDGGSECMWVGQGGWEHTVCFSTAQARSAGGAGRHTLDSSLHLELPF